MYYRAVFRCMTYGLFFIVLFLLWAKPVEIVDDYTEVDSEGHILRVNGVPFIDYLKVSFFHNYYLQQKGIDIRDIEIEDKEYYLSKLPKNEM